MHTDDTDVPGAVAIRVRVRMSEHGLETQPVGMIRRHPKPGRYRCRYYLCSSVRIRG